MFGIKTRDETSFQKDGCCRFLLLRLLWWWWWCWLCRTTPRNEDAIALLQSGARDIQMENCGLRDAAEIIAETLLDQTTLALKKLNLRRNGISGEWIGMFGIFATSKWTLSLWIQLTPFLIVFLRHKTLYTDCNFLFNFIQVHKLRHCWSWPAVGCDAATTRFDHRNGSAVARWSRKCWECGARRVLCQGIWMKGTWGRMTP